ncbi:hypothetical protein [Fodinicola acaciae]|uniref:hypothetical protein n=1 Tax=Fodinicola acaciae TaxID=2681555 RepID=UPI0013D628FF|nr:hypothetical protein [Fodinicola acaciae]
MFVRRYAPIAGIIGAALLTSISGVAAVAATPAHVRVFQLNMCMWGSNIYNPAHPADSCFPNQFHPGDAGYEPAETQMAEAKRQSVISRVRDFQPDAVTISEGCRADVVAIAAGLRNLGLPYAYQAFETGRGNGASGYGTAARQCTVGRGDSVNAILVKGTSGSVTAGYFEAGPSYYGYRSFVCAVLGSGVRVCTAHLSLTTQNDGGYYHNPAECSVLRTLLDQSTYPTVFAGDVNRKAANQHCAPDRYWGLKDLDWAAGDRTPQSGLQHIYYSRQFTRDSCGEVHVVGHTDHKGFLLDLVATSQPSAGKDCGIREIR